MWRAEIVVGSAGAANGFERVLDRYFVDMAALGALKGPQIGVVRAGPAASQHHAIVIALRAEERLIARGDDAERVCQIGHVMHRGR